MMGTVPQSMTETGRLKALMNFASAIPICLIAAKQKGRPYFAIGTGRDSGLRHDVIESSPGGPVSPLSPVVFKQTMCPSRCMPSDAEPPLNRQRLTWLVSL